VGVERRGEGQLRYIFWQLRYFLLQSCPLFPFFFSYFDFDVSFWKKLLFSSGMILCTRVCWCRRIFTYIHTIFFSRNSGHGQECAVSQCQCDSATHAMCHVPHAIAIAHCNIWHMALPYNIYLYMYVYVKIRRHQHTHTRVHAHTGPRRHTRAQSSGVSFIYN